MTAPAFAHTRRSFGLALGGAMAARLFGAPDAPWAGPATVRKVFLAVPQPTWPRPDLDVAREKAALEAVLDSLERKHAGAVRFTGGELLRTAEDAENLVRNLGDPDGVVIVDLTSGTGPLLRPLEGIAAPVLLYSRPYSGWSYVNVAGWVQAGKRADLVVSSEPGDLDPYVAAFRAVRHLRRSKVLVVAQGAGRSKAADGFHERYGTSFAFPGYADLKAAFDAADPAQAQRDAGAFARAALRVVEPQPAEIAAAMRLYRGVLAVLEREQANAITVDCLGGFRRGDLPAYPCVAWSKLNDAGLFGVCEADVPAAVSQILMTSVSGKPAFVSDPVFDTGRNEVIHAHCVSATALRGMGGPASPYIVRSHMEDNKGVSLQVLAPVGETVTVGKFLDPQTFAVSTGEVTGNVDDARGCRTKFRTRVADARRMLEGFRGGLHRVVVYGDCTGAIERTGRLAGFRVVREG